MRKTFDYVGKYETYKDCYFRTNKYESNNNLCISIYSETEGCICKVTVNTCEVLSDDEIAIKDYSENEGMYDWLLENGFVESASYTIGSAYVYIPVCRITDKMREYCGL